VTLGGRGALLRKKGHYEMLSPPDVKVVDTTAAGDTFTAAFMIRMSESGDVIGAIEYANAAASIAVSRMGAQSSIPTALEVQEFLRKIQS